MGHGLHLSNCSLLLAFGRLPLYTPNYVPGKFLLKKGEPCPAN
jgi:hypothetical protein